LCLRFGGIPDNFPIRYDGQDPKTFREETPEQAVLTAKALQTGLVFFFLVGF